ncbi:MAG: dipeptidase [Acidobacteriota bacterium]|nr:dipeptidase [Acidobacteriota bacterium]
MRRQIPLLILIALCTISCSTDEPVRDDSITRARDLARRVMIVDTHVDVPYRLQTSDADISGPAPDGDFDYPRAVEGGLDLPFMSIYVPASYQETGGAKVFADQMLDQLEAIVAEHPDKFALVHDSDDAERIFAAGKIGFALGMENGAPVEGDLANLSHFHERGIRYITLTHSKDNEICDSSYDPARTWNGLSPFGHEVVAEMNRLGIMIDVSHISDAAFEQVLDVTRAPVIASHSSCRHFTPDFERNMSDEMIRRLAENGGVIQINFGSSFLDGTYQKARSAHWKAVGEYLDENGIDHSSAEAADYQKQYFTDRPLAVSTLERVVEHIEHVVKLVGVDHVGIGSDFDGVGDSLPKQLQDVSAYPNLIAELLRRGYDDAEVEKICGGNLLRVWKEVEQAAAAQ